MKKKNSDYFLGLDIGTNSVGWAVTDTSYNLLKFNKKAMWGVHLFEEGQNTADTRKFRTARRRNTRKQWRIGILQALFKDEIEKVDPAFFIRLKESFLRSDDRTSNCHFSLFNDKDYTDADYHKDYPTIHHLINNLATSEVPRDVRHLYLAVSYIISHRGHFLFDVDKDNIDGVVDFKPIYDAFKSYVETETDLGFVVNDNDIEEFKKIISDRGRNTTKKKDAIKKIVSGDEEHRGDKEQKSQREAVISLICGGTAELRKLFNNENYKDIEPKSISLKGDFEATEAAIAADLGDDFEFVVKLKAIYDWSVLSGILGGDKSISAVKVKSFDEYGVDLKNLKDTIKAYLPEKYGEVFRANPDKNLKNYAAYTGFVEVKGKKENLPKEQRASQKEFYGYIEKILEKIENEEGVSDILSKIVAGTFLSKQKTSDNATIPYQLYYHELKNILENAEKSFKFLNQKDDNGLSVSDKILKLFEHRIPYYVGPLHHHNEKEEHKWAWAVRNSDEKIYPWNFEEVVNLKDTREKFIRRMTCKCTYLHQEDVIPKNSLLYSEFELLNEINKVKIIADGREAMTSEIKNRILNDLFKKENKKITTKRLKDFLVKENIIGQADDLAGFDVVVGIKSHLKSYHDFKRLLKSGTLSKDNVEEIIKYITLFGEEKKVLEQWLREKYPQITSEDVKYILKLKYKDWGRLSEKLLQEIQVTNKETGEIWDNIITAMRETNYNFMELAEGKSFDVSKQIEALNQDEESKKTLDEFLDARYISNAVKRQITRSMAVVKEIEKVMGDSPKRIFIEMARGGGEKDKRTKSRKTQVEDLYKDCKKEVEEYLGENSAKLKSIEESRFQSDKLFLYCLQLGRCMYTGEPIDIEDLFNNTTWDIDHIYPQSKVKDDSLDNRVLVNKEINAKKTNGYPLNGDIQKRMDSFWKMLKEKKLISDEKYLRLTRTGEFDDKELAGFINRQIVETRQSTKALAEWLSKKNEDSKIIYVKSGLVSEFRQNVIDMLKCREINDFHHAKDAYLNIVAGNVYDTRFGDVYRFIKENKGDYNVQIKRICGEYKYSEDEGVEVKKDEKGRKKYGINVTNAWESGEDGTVKTVIETMLKNNILSTRYTFCRKGGYFDQQLVSKGKGQYEIKKGLEIEKYGGYNKLTATYFVLVKHTDKGKSCISIKPVDLIYAPKSGKNLESLQKYCENQLGLENPEVIRALKVNTMLYLDGAKVTIASKKNNGERIGLGNAMQLMLDSKKEVYIKKLSSFLEKMKKDGKYKIKQYDKVDKEKNMELYDCLKQKISNNSYSKILASQIKTLENGRETFGSLPVEEQCKVLLNITSLFKCGRATGCDLSLIRGSKNEGVVTLYAYLSKTKYASIKIVNQSNTGLFEQVSENLLEL